MAITKKSTLLNKRPSSGPSAGVEEGEDESEQQESPKAKPGTKTKVKVGSQAEAAPNVELVALFEAYDENVKAAEKKFIELVEFIQENDLDRATVIASMMIARGINFESAQSQYSRMKKMYNNPEVLEELKSGKISLKVAREKTKKAQTNPASAKPEAKEQKFSSTLKAFVAACKESGFSRKEIMVTFEAELKAAQIK